MPFTLSHAAAALPLKRGKLIFSALVIGSMAPDFAYFVPLPFNSSFGHTLPGVALFDLPAGLLVLWLFHVVLKNPFFALLPASHQQRLVPYLRRFRFGGWRRFALILLSLLLGTLTHLAWDSFTHQEGLVVQWIPLLSTPLFSLGSARVMVYSLLQHGCTVLGLALLAAAYARWYHRAPLHALRARPQLDGGKRAGLVLAMLGGGLVFGVALGLLSVPQVDSLHHLRMLVSSMVVNTISMVGLEALVYGAIWHMGRA